MDPKSRLRVRYATQADALACQEIRYTAFRPGPMSLCMFPGEAAGNHFEKGYQSVKEEIAARGQDKSRCHVLVAELLPEGHPATDGVPSDGGREATLPPEGVEASDANVRDAALLASGIPPSGPNPMPRAEALHNPETGGIIVAFAKWHLYRDPRPEEEWNEKKPATREVYGDGADLECVDAFLGGLRNMRQKYIRGTPHFILSLLACAPNYQRLGAATALVRWGTSLADQEEKACWLEASPPGYPVYARLGFKDVAVLDLEVTQRWGIRQTDSADWGGKNAVKIAGELPSEGWHRTVLMDRKPAIRAGA